MKLLGVCLAALFYCLGAECAPADPDRLTIAVLDFQPVNAPASDATVLSGFVRDAVVNLGTYLVVERQSMNKVLGEQAFQQTGCTAAECAVKLGKLLNARKIIVGTYTVLDRERYLSARTIDVESGQIERVAKVRGFDLKSGDQAADDLVRKLAGRGDDGVESSDPARRGAYAPAKKVRTVLADLIGRRVAASEVKRVGDLMRKELSQYLAFDVIESQIGGVKDEATAMSLGKMLKAQRVIWGSIVADGPGTASTLKDAATDAYTITVKVEDMGSMMVIFEEASGSTIRTAGTTVVYLASRIAERGR